MDNGKAAPKKKAQMMSLTDLLAKKSSGAQTRSKVSTLEELQKKLSGNQGSSSSLNISKALNIGNEKMKLLDPSQIKTEEDVKSNKLNLLNQNNQEAQNVGRNKFKNVKFDPSADSKSSYGVDAANRTHKEYERMIARAEKEKFISFDDEEDHESKLRIPGFNLINLPKDINLEKGRLNVYKSGLIEIVSNDPIPKVFRLKPTIFNSGANSSSLIVATDSQVLLDTVEVYESCSLKQE